MGGPLSREAEVSTLTVVNLINYRSHLNVIVHQLQILSKFLLLNSPILLSSKSCMSDFGRARERRVFPSSRISSSVLQLP